MSLDGSEAGPTLTASSRAASRLRTASRIGRWTRSRLPGHAELSGEDGERLLDFGQRFVQVASSNSKTGVLPPSSPPKRFMFLAQAAMIARPVPELPVKLMTGTSGESIIVRAARRRPRCRCSPPPSVRLATSLRTSHIRAFVCAVNPGSSPTVVQPAASAGANDRTNSTTGEFHGAMMPATPAASRSVVA
jgi:hypothetical protein